MGETSALSPMEGESEAVRTARAQGFALAEGMLFAASGGGARPAPFAYLPFPVDRGCFRRALELGPVFSRVMETLTLNPELLFRLLGDSYDEELTGKMVQVAREAYGVPPPARAGAVAVTAAAPERVRCIRSDLTLTLTRSDYMIERCGDAGGGGGGEAARSRAGYALRQVEINAIALSYAALPRGLRDFHRESLRREEGALAADLADLPENNAFRNLIETLYVADAAFRAKYRPAQPTCVLLVAHPAEVNEVELAVIAEALSRRSGRALTVLRRTLAELAEMRESGALRVGGGRALRPGTLTLRVGRRPVGSAGAEASGTSTPDAVVNPDAAGGGTGGGSALGAGSTLGASSALGGGSAAVFAVSLVYYRTGYAPADYETSATFPADTCWAVRSFMEISDAVKIPNILTHLAGVKKVQAAWWADPKMFETLCGNGAEAKTAYETFVEQHVIEPATQPAAAEPAVARPTASPAEQPAVATDAARPTASPAPPSPAVPISEALADPSRFLLKPLREGGANNIAGAAMCALLRHPERRTQPYILMRLIRAEERPAALFGGGPGAPAAVREGPAVTELGVFAARLSDGGNVIRDEMLGHLLRTKFVGTVEGGVTIGAGFLDTPRLV